MQGIRIFSTLAEAEAAGFMFFMQAADAIIVQRADGRVKALAVVKSA